MFNTNNKIKLVIIAVPNKQRLKPLLNQLSDSKIFEIVIFSAIMFSKQSSEFKPNFSKQKTVYGRPLTDGEIGSAISHWKVQKFFAGNGTHCIILEDDARITDINNFEKLILDFIQFSQNTSSVLTLLPWGSRRLSGKVKSLELRKLSGRPRQTVAYIATSKALEELSSANIDYSYLPDWPPSNTRYFATLNGVVEHGDSETYSLIDKTGSRKTIKFYTIIKFFMLPFLLNKKQFAGFKEYLGSCLLPSLTWRIDKFNFRFFVFKQNLLKLRNLKNN